MPNINNLILVLSYLIQKKKKSFTWRHKLWVSVSHIPCPRNDFPSIRKRKRKKKNNGNSEILGTTCFNLFKNSN